jgi:hypothetical protein
VGKHFRFIRKGFAESTLIVSSEETNRKFLLTAMCDPSTSALGLRLGKYVSPFGMKNHQSGNEFGRYSTLWLYQLSQAS